MSNPSSFPWRLYHIQALGDAILRVDELQYPADSVLRHFFRENAGLGQGDRGFIAEGVFAYLRRRRSLTVLSQATQQAIWQSKQRAPREDAPERAGHGAEHSARSKKLVVPGKWLAVAVLVRELGYSVQEVREMLDTQGQAWLDAFCTQLSTPLSEIDAADVPDALWAQLGEDYDAETRAQLAQAWAQSVPFDLRVNELKTSRAEALTALTEEGWQVEATPYSPLGIRVSGRPKLVRHPWLADGKLEVQSESSQLAGLLLAPRRGEMVADFCAGAGGKTLLLGMLMRSQGRLYAFDVSDKRLQKLTPRMARSGLSNVHPQRIASERDPKLKRLAGKMDRVLVDAPCTGTGTLQRNPDQKWKYSETMLAELTAKQASILEAAAKLVKAGGRLVYATCSVLGAENEAIVTQFLKAHPEFSLQPAAPELARAQVPLATGDFLKLLPQEHHTDGFFAAVMTRQAAKQEA